MKIAIWNVNSIKARKDHALKWLQDTNTDVLMIQELKGEIFPEEDFTALGYHVHAHGQKAYNGVATLSKQPLEMISNELVKGDEQARFLECKTACGMHLINIYAPNGNPVDSDKYPYKLRWLDQLIERAESLLAQGVPFLIGGDYNIIPTAIDCANPSEWTGDALFKPETIARYHRLCWLGLTDAFRALHPNQAGHYSFWDYQAGSWQRDNGIRIDHFLCSPEITDRIKTCQIDKTPRGWEKPSDHTAVVLDLD